MPSRRYFTTYETGNRWEKWSRPKRKSGSKGLAAGVLFGLGLAQLYGAWRWGEGRWEHYALVSCGLASIMASSLVMRRDRRGVLLGYLVLLAMAGSAIVSLLKTGTSAPGLVWLLAAYGGARKLSEFDSAQQQIEEDARYRELFAETKEEDAENSTDTEK